MRAAMLWSIPGVELCLGMEALRLSLAGPRGRCRLVGRRLPSSRPCCQVFCPPHLLPVLLEHKIVSLASPTRTPTTFSDGCLGSSSDEGRSELRYAL